MALPRIHLRAEQKPHEHRSFSPAVIGALVAAGFPVDVERTPQDPAYLRIFSDDEYASVGASLVAPHTWPDAAPGTIILGLKELPEGEGQDFPLTNDHVTFAHCFKNQGGWESVLGRWARGGGTLYDLEFLVDQNGRRVSAFGYHAGFAGAALGAKAWAWQLSHPASEPLPAVSTFTSGRGYYLDEAELVAQITADIKSAGRVPKVMVLGALGRCGRGAVDLFLKAGVPEESITRWDIGDTTGRDGPYDEIAKHDIFVNAIYLSEPIPPFINAETLSKEGRKLGVVVDVSCDTSNPHNPIPIYSINTTFTSPTVPVSLPSDAAGNPALSVISIDHLPSMLPREASESFSDGLRESLLQLGERASARVWADAKKLFDQKVALLPANLRAGAVQEM